MKAKKSFGQHFLTNMAVAKKIVEALSSIGDPPNVLEVGPGKGVLTGLLLDMDIRLKAVDADIDMIDYLKREYPALDLIYGDFLKVDFYEIFEGKPFSLIGNFPYNISSQIVFHMLEAKELVPEMVGMFQKEMADRIIASPGNKDYGIISVLTQAYYKGNMIIKVSEGSFNPPPKVKSGVIRLERLENPRIMTEWSLFRKVVKQAFSQRRKMLRNTMKVFIKDERVLSEPFFERRPETLSVEEFDGLCQKIIL